MKKWLNNNYLLFTSSSVIIIICIYLFSGTISLGAAVGGTPVTIPSSSVSATKSSETVEKQTSTTSDTQTDKKVYVVKKEETLWEIAQDTHVSVQTLMTNNQLNSSLIFEGQELVISTAN